MKRDGRQHGMVQAFWAFEISRRRQRRIFEEFDAPTTRSLCTKVSSKPNNHSKYTSRCRHRPQCRGCHVNPPCKSLGKVKGVHKVRSASGVWEVVDGFRGLKFSGASASGVLDYLWGDQYCMDHDCIDDEASPRVLEVANEFDSDIHAIDECEDDRMGFCEVDFVLELLDIEDPYEDWFLVEEI